MRHRGGKEKRRESDRVMGELRRSKRARDKKRRYKQRYNDKRERKKDKRVMKMDERGREGKGRGGKGSCGSRGRVTSHKMSLSTASVSASHLVLEVNKLAAVLTDGD